MGHDRYDDRRECYKEVVENWRCQLLSYLLDDVRHLKRNSGWQKRCLLLYALMLRSSLKPYPFLDQDV